MKRKRFTEEQIIGILKEAEAGAKKQDLCRVRRQNISNKNAVLLRYGFHVIPLQS